LIKFEILLKNKENDNEKRGKKHTLTLYLHAHPLLRAGMRSVHANGNCLVEKVKILIRASEKGEIADEDINFVQELKSICVTCVKGICNDLLEFLFSYKANEVCSDDVLNTNFHCTLDDERLETMTH
jgi:hypothetical protein